LTGTIPKPDRLTEPACARWCSNRQRTHVRGENGPNACSGDCERRRGARAQDGQRGCAAGWGPSSACARSGKVSGSGFGESGVGGRQAGYEPRGRVYRERRAAGQRSSEQSLRPGCSVRRVRPPICSTRPPRRDVDCRFDRVHAGLSDPRALKGKPISPADPATTRRRSFDAPPEHSDEEPPTLGCR
jgi:hypothetical protein